MHKILLIAFFIGIACVSCKTSEKEIDQLDITKQYYKALDASNHIVMSNLLTDSLLTRETEYDYEQVFTLDQYKEWVKWDAVFEPTYEVLSILKEDEIVKATVSKNDTRIQFLHGGSIVTNQVLRFSEDKIKSIETTKYVVFNDSLFVKNREEFLSWMEQNHPDLNNFIYDQTEAGGMKYLKAIELFTNRK
ncbi:hypothetical protein [Flagellimonas flava]|nr:hypothetical protein [Allomuricauda flava]